MVGVNHTNSSECHCISHKSNQFRGQSLQIAVQQPGAIYHPQNKVKLVNLSGIPLQSLPHAAAADRDRAPPRAVGAADQDLVPEPEDEAQEGDPGDQGAQRAGEAGAGGQGGAPRGTPRRRAPRRFSLVQ